MAKKLYTRLFRQRFLDKWFLHRHEVTFAEHCERFGVSRQAGYEWLAKYEQSGVEGLETKKSSPHHCPHATDEETVKMIVDARLEHPTWGPKKLKAWLENQFPCDLQLPALSTIGDIIKRAGLVPTKKRRKRVPPYSTPYTSVSAPNDVWTADFKGQFRMLDRRLCYPLTLFDCFSRYLLRCDAYHSPNSDARASFESAFIEFGMPLAIRSDNGAPFVAAHAPAGLSALSVWWVRLGIIPERIPPASPWENGRHERMHRTLKEEATSPPQTNRKQQQRAFDSFQREFNYERPHEALGQKPPSASYNTSKRSYPKTVPELEYAEPLQLRRVSDAGVIGWKGGRVFVSTVLRGEVVGLKQTDDECWEVYFGPIALGTLDARDDELEFIRHYR